MAYWDRSYYVERGQYFQKHIKGCSVSNQCIQDSDDTELAVPDAPFFLGYCKDRIIHDQSYKTYSLLLRV